MKLLIKFPTRGRRRKFVDIMGRALNNIVNFKDTSFLLTLDSGDEEMSKDFLDKRIDFYKKIYSPEIELDYIYGESKNKIHAVNRDLDVYNKPWDVVLLLSDDMECIKYGFDEIIRNDIVRVKPDLDCVLHYPDGWTELNTLPILGKKYYDRFGYIYYPEYESFFSDNEFMEVATVNQRHYQSKMVLFVHNHPVWTGKGWDDVYERNNTPWEKDKKLYEERKEERIKEFKRVHYGT